MRVTKADLEKQIGRQSHEYECLERESHNKRHDMLDDIGRVLNLCFKVDYTSPARTPSVEDKVSLIIDKIITLRESVSELKGWKSLGILGLLKGKFIGDPDTKVDYSAGEYTNLQV